MANFLTQLLPNTQDSEIKYIAFILKNPNEAYLISEHYFFDDTCKLILQSVKKVLEKNLSFNIDEVYYFCKEEKPNFEKSILTDIAQKSTENIQFIKEVLRENYIKYSTITKLENLIVDATTKESISFDKLTSQIDSLYNSLHDLSSVTIETSEDLANKHLEILEQRKKGIKKRSLGYRVLDQNILRPAAPEEMTGIVGMKGGAKSTFVKNIENRLIAKGIQVVSVNLEMSVESCNDRIACMRMNIPLSELLRRDMNPRLESKIKKEIESYKNIKNYLFYSQPTLSLSELDGLLYKAKHIFKNRGVIQDDLYMFVVIDLLDMVDEFSESQSSYNIKTAINKLHAINRKHGCHFLLVLQANENKLRSGKIFKKPEELDYYKIGLEDIEGSAAIAQRCRVVMTLTRPVQMKKRFFPEENERWDLEEDIINVNVCKQNDGPEFFTKFIMTNTFRICQYIECQEEVE